MRFWKQYRAALERFWKKHKNRDFRGYDAWLAGYKDGYKAAKERFHG